MLLPNGAGVFDAAATGRQFALGQHLYLIQAADHVQRLSGAAVGFPLRLAASSK